MKTLDACGISCPEPLLRLKNALKTEKEIILLVDSKNALDNCENYARKNGFRFETTTGLDKYKMHITVAN